MIREQWSVFSGSVQKTASVLIVFLIGLALTIIRAVTKSVAAGVLTHMAYNGWISVLVFMVSGGFRHLDRIAQ